MLQEFFETAKSDFLATFGGAWIFPILIISIIGLFKALIAKIEVKLWKLVRPVPVQTPKRRQNQAPVWFFMPCTGRTDSLRGGMKG